MRLHLAAILGLLASACGTEDAATQNAAVDMSATNAAAPVDRPAAASEPANRFVVDEDQDGLAFSYSWPGEAEAIPALRARLRAEMDGDRREAIGYVREEESVAGADREPMEHSYSRSWTLAGNNAQMLSLSATEESFTGGAHGNHRFFGLIWDRQANAPVAPAALLGPALAGFESRFCAALNGERAERRGEPVPPPRDEDDSFNACPPFSELVVVPADADGNGRFERLAVLIAPYVAGPYAEGGYVIDLPIAAADIDRLPQPQRALFETGRPLPPQREE